MRVLLVFTVSYQESNAALTPYHNYCNSEMTACDVLLGSVHTFGLGHGIIALSHLNMAPNVVRWSKHSENIALIALFWVIFTLLCCTSQ